MGHGLTSIPDGRTEKRRPTPDPVQEGDSVRVRKHVRVIVGVRSVGRNCPRSGGARDRGAEGAALEVGGAARRCAKLLEVRSNPLRGPLDP